MAGAKLKKLSILAAREDMENILSELMLLGCADISEPDDLPEDFGPASDVMREIINLDGQSANRESISVLGTRYTLSLSGWMTAKSETELVSKLADYVCAWDIADQAPGDSDKVPVVQRCPGFFGKLRRGGRNRFDPLKSSVQLPIDRERQSEDSNSERSGHNNGQY